jgi:hypothetical protein
MLAHKRLRTLGRSDPGEIGRRAFRRAPSEPFETAPFIPISNGFRRPLDAAIAATGR